jgi:DNA invertase Pin-like site-specific DNA recombinase
MDNRTFYYARVSSKDQNLDRQLAAFKALSADERDIITDKERKRLQPSGLSSLKERYAPSR